MPIPWGLVTFFVGAIYGWLSPGRQSKTRLFVNGLLIGFIIALVLGLLGYMAEAPPIGLAGMAGVVVSVLILTLLFILGAWLGDIIEGATNRGRTQRRTY
ncbi:MAG TPA: hypothetical protein VI818_05350 [Candidatus Thermoplasmatota archaeon]|nr:hypothetical protein [Candidatus Thermoplasmatota archaeon]